MKAALLVASLAVSSMACIVPSTSSLDTRLAAVGINPTPYKWGVEAQLRIADERRAAKGPTDIPKRTILWASGATASGLSVTPTIGEVTRATSAVRVGIEHSFGITGVPEKHHAAVTDALAVVGGSIAGSNAAITVHSLDCSHRNKAGWTSMACDLEVGPGGKTLLSLANGKVDKGILKGPIVNHDAASVKGMRYSVMCDTDDDSEDDGKADVNAFALVIAVPDATNAGSEKDATHQRYVEVVLRFTKSNDGALSEEGAPTTVVGEDGVAVYLLRGNTVLSRWALPLAYGLGLLFALPYAAKWATNALTPKPSVNIAKDGAVATAGKK